MICEPIINMMSKDQAKDRREIDEFLAKVPERKFINWDKMPHALTGGIIWACGPIKKILGNDFDYHQATDLYICKQSFDNNPHGYYLVDLEYGKSHTNCTYWGIKASKNWR